MAKAILFVVFTVLFANTVSAANSNAATKGDLKQMLEYLDKPASIEKIIFAVRTDSTLRRELREALKVH